MRAHASSACPSCSVVSLAPTLPFLPSLDLSFPPVSWLVSGEETSRSFYRNLVTSCTTEYNLIVLNCHTMPSSRAFRQIFRRRQTSDPSPPPQQSGGQQLPPGQWPVPPKSEVLPWHKGLLEAFDTFTRHFKPHGMQVEKRLRAEPWPHWYPRLSEAVARKLHEMVKNKELPAESIEENLVSIQDSCYLYTHSN